ncbi:MAG: hypothetical protein ACWA41_04290 [Putridiphycobacter sp.]
MKVKQNKNVFVKTSIMALALMVMTSCGSSETTTEEHSTDSETTTEQTENTEEAPEAVESSNYTCEKLYNDFDNLEGQEITITAISWGTQGTLSGGKMLNLGDEKLEGMKQAKVVVKFAEGEEAMVDGISMDDQVTVTGTVESQEYGHVVLVNPKMD